MALVWTGVAVAALLTAEGVGIVSICAFAAAYARLLTWDRLRPTATEADLRTARWVSGVLTSVLVLLMVGLAGGCGYFPLFAPAVLPFLVAEGILSLSVWGVEPDRPDKPALPA